MVSKTVRDSGRELHQLLKVVEDSKVVGLFTRMVSERR